MKRVVVIGEENRHLVKWLAYFIDTHPYDVQLDVVTTATGVQWLQSGLYDVFAFVVMDSFLDDTVRSWLEKHPCRNVVVLRDMYTDRLSDMDFVSADIEAEPHIVVQTYLPIMLQQDKANEPMIVVVMSVCGGCGVTTLAQACVREMNRIGVSVVYVETHAFSQFANVYEHVPVSEIADMLEQGKYAHYQMVVIDLTWSDDWESIVAMAHKVCIVTTGDTRVVRTQRFLERLERREKYMIIENTFLKQEPFVSDEPWQQCCVSQIDMESQLPQRLMWWLKEGCHVCNVASVLP